MFQVLKIIHDYRIKKALSNTYDALAILHGFFFNSYLKQESLVKQTKKIYQKQVKFIKALQRARQTIKDDTYGRSALINIDKLHEVICSLHLLRFRFHEFALFEVCFEEMQNLQKISTKLLHDMKKKIFEANTQLDLSAFMSAIHAFENLYSSTLQVVARDPMVFQFFIQDLYALHVLMISDSDI